ncbi:MAG TPA: hypothetical protein VH109_11495 [Steroidobacteraceae bacterium]|nr:hypothetical protein [Steroidobacteraceae bacterium]
MTLEGGCHCGNVRLTLSGVPEGPALVARECGCSFCVKHGGLWASVPGASLVVAVAHPSEVHAYTFGTKSADFHVCRICGVVPLVTSLIDSHLYALVSVRALAGIAAASLERRAADFEGEGMPERLARRAGSWIRDVRFAQRPGARRAAARPAAPPPSGRRPTGDRGRVRGPRRAR